MVVWCHVRASSIRDLQADLFGQGLGQIKGTLGGPHTISFWLGRSALSPVKARVRASEGKCEESSCAGNERRSGRWTTKQAMDDKAGDGRQSRRWTTKQAMDDKAGDGRQSRRWTTKQAMDVETGERAGATLTALMD
jgi:hypothetical protein